MRKSRLIKHLEQLEAEDLREELSRLYDMSKEVQTYYAMELGTEAERQKKYEKAKAAIATKFTSRSRKRVRRPRVNKVKLIVKELERHTIFPHEMIDIHLYVCEQALTFGETYYYSSAPLYNLIVDNYSKAQRLIEDHLMKEDYRDRVDAIHGLLPTDLQL